MATAYIRIGSAVNCVAYDDADFPDAAIETLARIKSGTAPSDPTDVVRLEDLLDTSIFETLINSIVMFEDRVIGFNNNIVFL